MPNIIDALKDFALPGMRLFPCDTPTLTNASARAFDTEAKKLPAGEKIAAARHIAKRAGEQNVSVHDTLAARVAGSEISDMFKVALFTRKEVCAWHPEALRDLNEIARVAGYINKQAADMRAMLLDKLAAQIESFDKKWDKDMSWRECGVPDAVDTVFAKAASEVGVVRVGAREVRARDFVRFDKAAAALVLTPEVLAMANDFTAFVAGDDVSRAALVAFIPESRA